MVASVLVSPSASLRRANAREWLLAQPAGSEVLVVGATLDAANELVREATVERGAAFGWHRTTLPRLAAVLAREPLAQRGAVAVGHDAIHAVVASVVHAARQRGELGRYADAAGGPGLVRALGSALDEVRLADADSAVMAEVAPELERMRAALDTTLEAMGLADRAQVFRLAGERAVSGVHLWLGLPTVFVDVPLAHALEHELVRAVAVAAPDVLATVPTGDVASQRAYESRLGVSCDFLSVDPAGTSLERLQTHLFEATSPVAAPGDTDVAILSAPSENRECVEIARRVQRLDIPFDRIAILLRAPEVYRGHIVEALQRARVPFHFARGARAPDPTGRAFMALLACAAEDLSAKHFAAYLSLDQVPRASPKAPPPGALERNTRWVAPDEEMLSATLADALVSRDDAQADEPDRLRPPRRWERLLMDAAVIGGRERWTVRIEGLRSERELDRAALCDPDDPAAARIERDLEDLASLRDFALPLLADLAALPTASDWGAWIDALGALATRALRRPGRVLSALSELAPMRSVGPVKLEEVRFVLGHRLLEFSQREETSRYGRVFVGAIDAVRGLEFDAVFVPGLAEKLFPKKLEEEPVLLDSARERIGGLPTREDRLRDERLALRIAAGAANQQLFLSYPRLDTHQSRPRVQSWYLQDTFRAVHGFLPGLDELARAAERVTAARVGWPAPRDPDAAIDDAEYDLAVLRRVDEDDSEKSRGAARYLLDANPHLGRALRFRARRWLNNWTVADGLVKPGEAGRAAIAAHSLRARSFSPTALQHYAACPYRFYLYAVHRLAPREVPEAIEELDALQRGSMVHDVQFRLFERLRDAKALPVSEQTLALARTELDAVLDEVAAEYRDELAPAMDRVWTDGIDSVRADLREWLERAADDPSGYVPWRFELSFGLTGRREADPHSQAAAVSLDCGIQLRGSIDLVERHPDGVLRVTDHKTGKVRFQKGGLVEKGQALQPVLYALAIEQLFPEAKVESGRLYYCTTAGGFAERTVPLDAEARESAKQVADAIGQALAEPFLPAAPAAGACRWCDYQSVCGPYEEVRTARKPVAALEPLVQLRGLR